jgi:hypothetical protein
MNSNDVTHERALALTGSEWLRQSRGVLVIDLKGEGLPDAIAVIDARAGRMLAFIGPEFPPSHPLAALEPTDIDAFTAIFEGVPNQWFLPRVRGVIAGTVHAIRYGLKTPRSANQAIAKLLRSRPSQQPTILRDNRPMQRLLDGLSQQPADQRRRILKQIGEAFPPERGNLGDENRTFFLQAITDIARDAGCPLTLPTRDDEDATTTLFAFVLRAREIVLDRAIEETVTRPFVRRRLAPFNCTRVALIDAVERVRQSVQK